MFEITRITEKIWHVEEAKGVFFSVIMGDNEALVIDTGHGIGDIRAFVEENVHVPYTVINTHGHPDHTGGNRFFERVYLHPADFPAFYTANTPEKLREKYLRLAQENGLDPDKAGEYAIKEVIQPLPLAKDEIFKLGGLTVHVCELPGHTRGSIGLLIEEERLLLSGDCFNPDMWMFADNHDTLDTLAVTLEKALGLPFDNYLGSHTTSFVPRLFLQTALENVRHRRIDWASYEVQLGRETYQIKWDGPYGQSVIAIPAEDALEFHRQQGRGVNTMLLHGPDQGKEETKERYGMARAPIYRASAFEHSTAEEIADIFAKRRPGFNYSRLQNPTTASFEEKMTQLEGGTGSVACASGMAAITYTVLNLLQSGDEFISTAGLYGGTIEQFKSFSQFGISVKYVPVSDTDALEAAITQRTKLIYAETIANPALEVAPISKLADTAHRHGIPLVIDNTAATALLVQPLKLGADIVINSASKYINGFAGGVSGVVTDGRSFSFTAEKYPVLEPFLARCGKDAFLIRMRSRMLGGHGGCLAPDNAYQNLVGLESLGLRFSRECSNAMMLAQHLEKVPGVTVNYPGLKSSASYDTACEVLKGGFGAVMTLRLGSRQRAFSFMNNLELARIMSNIGDVRTLVIHPRSTMALYMSDEECDASGVYDDLVRVSTGIEDIEDLIADFDNAVKKSSDDVIKKSS